MARPIPAIRAALAPTSTSASCSMPRAPNSIEANTSSSKPADQCPRPCTSRRKLRYTENMTMLIAPHIRVVMNTMVRGSRVSTVSLENQTCCNSSAVIAHWVCHHGPMTHVYRRSRSGMPGLSHRRMVFARLDAVTARLLCTVQGPVGTQQHGLQWLTAAVLARDADANGIARQVHRGRGAWLMQHLLDALRDQGGAFQVRIGQQHDEFLAAETGDKVTRAQGCGDHTRHVDQHQVPHGMAMGVIDGLEKIQVDAHHCQRQAAALQTRAFPGMRVGETTP